MQQASIHHGIQMPARNHAIQADILTFLQDRYERQQGHCCIGWIDGDPRKEQMRQEWYSWPAQSRQVAQRLAELAARQLNIYAAPCLFSERKRAYTTALPSPWLWQDEADAGDIYTQLIETSPDNYQAWIHLDQPLSAEDRSALQRGWRSASDTADTCSADAIHMARIPGGYNTKAHQQHLVRVAAASELTYPVDELRQRWPDADPSSSMPRATEWPDVERWLANVHLLLDKHGLPRRLTQNAQARKVLNGETIVRNRAGTESSSDARAWVAKGLILHRYPDDEAAALLIHLCDYGASTEKGSAWLYSDIKRILSIYRRERPDIVPEPSRVQPQRPPQPLPQLEKSRRGRRTVLTPAQLLSWCVQNLDSGNKVLLSRPDMAERLHISVGTLTRIERAATTAGLLRRCLSPNRRTSWIEILGLIKIPQQPPQQTSANYDSTEAIPAIEPPDSTRPAEHEGTHPPDLPAPAAPAAPRLVELVREALDVYGAKLKRVLRYIADNADGRSWSPHVIERCYHAELKHRRYERSNAAIAGRVRSLSWSALKRTAAAAGGRVAELRRRGKNAAWWTWYAGQLEAEITRRLADSTMPARASYRSADQGEQAQRRPGRTATAPAVAEQLPATSPAILPAIAECPGAARETAGGCVPSLPADDPWLRLQRQNLQMALARGDSVRVAWYRYVLGESENPQPRQVVKPRRRSKLVS